MEDEAEWEVVGAVIGSVAEEQALSSVDAQSGPSIPVLMGDSWPFIGCRVMAEDDLDMVDEPQSRVELKLDCWCK